VSADENVGVAYANDRVEAEMIQGLLESAGIRSFLRPVGIDGPTLGFGLLNPGGGSQQVVVRASDLERARTLLAATLVEEETDPHASGDDTSPPWRPWRRSPRDYGLLGAYARIWAWSLAALTVAFAVFLLSRGL
jgi:Putative prokaryotic signal transducing protein